MAARFYLKAMSVLETKFLDSLDFEFQKMYSHVVLKTLQLFWSQDNFKGCELLNTLLFKQLMIEFRLLNNPNINGVLTRSRFDKYLHNCVKMMIISLTYTALLGLQKFDLHEVHAAQLLITDLSDTLLPKGGRFVQFCEKLFSELDPVHHRHLEEEEEVIRVVTRPYKLQYLELCHSQKQALYEKSRKAEFTYSGSEIIKKFWMSKQEDSPSPRQQATLVVAKIKSSANLSRNASGPLQDPNKNSKLSSVGGTQTVKFGIMMKSPSSSTKEIRFSQGSAERPAQSVVPRTYDSCRIPNLTDLERVLGPRTTQACRKH